MGRDAIFNEDFWSFIPTNEHDIALPIALRVG